MTPWQRHVERWRSCGGCDLCAQRDRVVLARGKVPCDVLFIGEAPGESENVLGQPFVGPAGKLLDQIVERALQSLELKEEPRIAFTNLVACFPRDAKKAGTNEPDAAEIKACSKRLEEFIGLCAPRQVVCVGLLSSKWVNNMRVQLRLGDVPLAHVVHPAAILRMPAAQQAFAIQKCMVTIASAVKDLSVDPVL